MRKDILWEPFFFLAKHLPGSVSGWSEYYGMPVRLRNWLVQRTIESHKAEQDSAEAESSGKSNLDEGPGQRAFKGFKAF